jgi:glyoxylase-like metal-dependent hydrolase (beta-lactamase superfamily II)
MIDGGGETILIAGDAWHSPAQVAVPAWCHRADREPAEARRSRESLAAWACGAGALVAAGHFPEDNAFGRIVRDGSGGFAFAPVEAANERC